MKQLLCIAMLTVSMSALAQSDTTYWKNGGDVMLNLSQTTLKNWSAGGSEQFTISSFLGLNFDYAKADISWKNTIELGFGLIKDELRTQKGDDKILINSQYGRNLVKGNEKWKYNVALDFRTQFAYGYNPDKPNDYISKFMAPGYLVVSTGINWSPNQYFNVTISPLSGKMTFVNDDSLANAGAFGVEAAIYDSAVLITAGSHLRSEFGGKINVMFEKEIFKNGVLKSNLMLFSNYMDNPQYVDVNWENTLKMKINSVLSANIFNQIIYDYDIKFEVTEEINHVPVVVGLTEKVQLKNIFGLGLAYHFGAKRG